MVFRYPLLDVEIRGADALSKNQERSKKKGEM